MVCLRVFSSLVLSLDLLVSPSKTTIIVTVVTMIVTVVMVGMVDIQRMCQQMIASKIKT